MTVEEILEAFEASGCVSTNNGKVVPLGELRVLELGIRAAMTRDTPDSLDARLTEARYIGLSFADYLIALAAP